MINWIKKINKFLFPGIMALEINDEHVDGTSEYKDRKQKVKYTQ